ncbi:hypothetical protein ULG90_04835 [Halopseudomonas pachastrellae]|nr:hypothetical protein ULG90_04835 [Halopseudomonas pachastrellae]
MSHPVESIHLAFQLFEFGQSDVTGPAFGLRLGAGRRVSRHERLGALGVELRDGHDIGGGVIVLA